jgi:hypothetical protein
MLRPLTVVVVAAVLGAGCSNGSAGSGGDSAAATRAKAVTFAQCMRDNGVKDFPDPDASGELTVDGVLNGSSLDPDSAEWKKAIEACKDLEPPGFTGRRRSAEQQENALKFAQCMRDNGVADFPDPTPDGPLIDTNRIPSAAGRGAKDIPGFQAAIDQCHELLAGALDPDARQDQP